VSNFENRLPTNNPTFSRGLRPMSHRSGVQYWEQEMGERPSVPTFPAQKGNVIDA
jgi:hypothetical protein